MNVQAKLISDLRFAIKTDSGHEIVLDTDEPTTDQSSGPCPMDLLLSALAGCAGMEIITILRKMKQSISDYDIQVHAEKTSSVPRIFTSIVIEHHFTGQAINPTAIQRAIALVEDRYCAVSAMFDKKISIKHIFHLEENYSE